MKRRYVAVSHLGWQKHTDETAAIYLSETYLPHIYPGLSMDEVLIYGQDFDQAGLSASDWEERGYVLFGVGEGPYDPHGRDNTCAAVMLAQKFGLVDDYPELKMFLEHVNRVRNHGPSGMQDVGYVLGGISDLANSITWARFTYTAMIAKWSQSHFDEMAHQVYAESILAQFKSGGRQYNVVVADVPDDVPSIATIVFTDPAINVHVLVSRRESGHVGICSNKRNGPNLRGVGEILNEWDPAACWYLQESGGRVGLIVNGGRTHPEVPSTQLTLEEIYTAVVYGLT